MIRFVPKRSAVMTDDDCLIFGKRSYTILQTLHAAAGEIVSSDKLIAAAWPTATPADPPQSLASNINHLRGDVMDLGLAIEHRDGGYRLVERRCDVSPDGVGIRTGMIDPRPIPTGKGSQAHTTEFIRDAAKFWATGMSVAAIANALGVKKTAISGITHRNRQMFPLRPSPIKDRWPENRLQA
jgi:hypothetical protein